MAQGSVPTAYQSGCRRPAPGPPCRMSLRHGAASPALQCMARRSFRDRRAQVVKPAEARKIARAAGMDLVEVDGSQRPPVCKLQDAGKAAYQATQKEKVCAAVAPPPPRMPSCGASSAAAWDCTAPADVSAVALLEGIGSFHWVESFQYA